MEHEQLQATTAAHEQCDYTVMEGSQASVVNSRALSPLLGEWQELRGQSSVQEGWGGAGHPRRGGGLQEAER